MFPSWLGWGPTSRSTAPRRWCAACRGCWERRSWQPICAPHPRSCWPAWPRKAKPWSTGSIISTGATSAWKRSSRPAARGSKECEVPPKADPLRLRAEDADDLAIISACVQDALVSVRDLAYDRDAQSFMLVANRFCWECGGEAAGGAPPFERTLCGVAFEEVEGVAYRGFHRNEEDRILCFLAIRPTLEASGGSVDLEFAAGATIR